MKRFAYITVLCLLIFGQAASAIPITSTDGTTVRAGKVGLKSDKIEFRSTGGAGVFTLKAVGSAATSRTITIPDPGAAADFVMTQGTQTIAGVKTFSSPPTITGGITSANIASGSAKRELLTFHFAQNVENGVAADTKTYAGFLCPGRAGTVTAIGWGVKTAPTVGTDTLTVKKGVGGNTMLNAASFDANTLTGGAFTAGTLTAVGADLVLTATQGAEVIYNSGSQTVDAVDLSVIMEFEPADF